MASFTTTASVSLDPISATFPAIGGSGSIAVSSPSACTWLVYGNSLLYNPSSGRGNGTVNYTVQPNGSSSPADFQINIGDKQFRIHQDAGPACPTTITGAVPVVDAAARSFQFQVTTNPGCIWTMYAYDFWVSLTPLSGTGNTTVTANIAANSTNATRTTQFSALSPYGPGGSASLTQRQTTTTFADVAPGYSFFDAINLLGARSITNGCASSPARYCPDANITRGQMAVFIVRSVMGGDAFTYNTTPYFDDVPGSHQFFKWIQKLRELGITNGCTPTQYCPDATVTRGQTAVFIIRARFGASTSFSYPTTAQFSDVLSAHPFFSWIQKMSQIGITSGCTATQYCPDEQVTRGQMAVFVMRGAFNQLLPPNTPVIVSVSPATASPGQSLTVAITGLNTNFSGTNLRVTAGDNVSVSSIAVTSPTSMTARFTVAPTASPGPRSVTVSGFGPLEATLPNGFRIQ